MSFCACNFAGLQHETYFRLYDFVNCVTLLESAAVAPGSAGLRSPCMRQAPEPVIQHVFGKRHVKGTCGQDFHPVCQPGE